MNEWRSGWRTVAAAAAGLVASCPHYFTLSVFIVPLTDAFGWTRAQVTSGMALVSLSSVVLAPLVGLAIDRFGPRRIVLPGAILYALAFAGLSLSDGRVWTWLAGWTLLALVYPLAGAGAWAVGVSTRFERSRGMALALTMAGSSIGSMILPPLTALLLQQYGWRAAFQGLGALSLALTLLICAPWFYGAADLERCQGRKSLAAPRATLAGAPFAEALRSVAFWKLTAAFLAVALSVSILMSHFVPMATRAGLSLTEAAALAGLMGAANLAGKLGAGVLMDRVFAPRLAAAAFVAPAVAALVLLNYDGDRASAAAVALGVGLAVGVEVDLLAYLASRYFGLRALGAVYSTLVGVHTLGIGIGPLAGGLLFDATGAYDLACLAVIVALSAAAALVLTLGPYPVWRDAVPSKHGAP